MRVGAYFPLPPRHWAVRLLLQFQSGTLTHRPLDRLDRLANAIPGAERAEHFDQDGIELPRIGKVPHEEDKKERLMMYARERERKEDGCKVRWLGLK